jgi:hypothetical protein
VAGLGGDGVHQPADRVVHAQVGVGLLAHAVGLLGAQHQPRTALVDLEFVERVLKLPALRVERRELVGGGALGVKDRGQQPVG